MVSGTVGVGWQHGLCIPASANMDRGRPLGLLKGPLPQWRTLVWKCPLLLWPWLLLWCWRLMLRRLLLRGCGHLNHGGMSRSIQLYLLCIIDIARGLWIQTDSKLWINIPSEFGMLANSMSRANSNSASSAGTGVNRDRFLSLFLNLKPLYIELINT